MNSFTRRWNCWHRRGAGTKLPLDDRAERADRPQPARPLHASAGGLDVRQRWPVQILSDGRNQAPIQAQHEQKHHGDVLQIRDGGPRFEGARTERCAGVRHREATQPSHA